jgi:hypothetical protein
MSDRHELARLIGAHYDGCAHPVEAPNNWARATSIADAILAAGWVSIPAEGSPEWEAMVERTMQGIAGYPMRTTVEHTLRHAFAALRGDRP